MTAGAIWCAFSEFTQATVTVLVIGCPAVFRIHTLHSDCYSDGVSVFRIHAGDSDCYSDRVSGRFQDSNRPQ